MVLIASVPGHCLSFTFESTVKPCVHYRQKVNEILTWELHTCTYMYERFRHLVETSARSSSGRHIKQPFIESNSKHYYSLQIFQNMFLGHPHDLETMGQFNSFLLNCVG